AAAVVSALPAALRLCYYTRHAMNRKNSKGGGKKPRVEVVFDPDARKDYLTGFHKRKQARRRFGLAMQEIKDRKERLEERKERREAMKERREELGVQEDLGSFDIKAKAREDAKAKAEQLVEVDFEDGHTQARETFGLMKKYAMFGDTVTVTTVVGIPDSDDEEDARETARLEKELLQEKKRKRAEMLERGRGSGAGRGGVAGDSEGSKEERWSLAAVSKRLAANMPAKPRKGAAKRAAQAAAAATSEKGKKGKRAKKAAGGGGGGGGAALMDKARGSMPRAELSKGKKRR
ncbi:unnamed protein product, partial [Ectocarpus fasciculatus]